MPVKTNKEGTKQIFHILGTATEYDLSHVQNTCTSDSGAKGPFSIILANGQALVGSIVGNGPFYQMHEVKSLADRYTQYMGLNQDLSFLSYCMVN